MERPTLRQRHISICARMFGEKIGPAASDPGYSDPVVTLIRKPGRPTAAHRKALANAQPADLEDAHRQLDAAIYQKALSGDPNAYRQWKENNATTSENPFNCEFHITPYNIEDKSLAKIATQADVPIVMEILEGIRIRLEADGAPEELKGLRRTFQMQLDTWMRKAYEPKNV